ncbi:MAG TPA: 16S rRNA (uracil(1498)-N(3))-methyltransferase [Dehalococcoidales bacterium]|nr:16S rRNA (uracil(1498)-N(3))-methyltransferase [Dehalococcoidales bacterium]
MHRFYIDYVQGDRAALTDPLQLHHLKDVLRLKIGDSVSVFDAQGNEYSGAIEKIDKKQAIIKITPIQRDLKSKINLTIACAIPKGDRMDDVVDQLTQLGVSCIIPMVTERVIVKLDEAKKMARLKRWQTIAQSAAEQSQRSTLPALMPVTPFADVIKDAKSYDLKLVPHLSGARTPIKNIIAENPKNVIVLIGPEGDFTPEEVQKSLDVGFIPVSLGENVLRVATAAVAVASYLTFALADD